MQLLWPLVALVATPIAFFVGHLIYVLSKAYIKHKLNLAKYNNIPKHHDGNIFLSLLDPKRNTAEVYKVFTIPGKGDEIYDLVHIGPDLSGDEIIICCDPELAAPILSASDVNSFPKAPTYQFLADAIVGDGLVTTGGEYWKSHRHVLTPLFHFKSLKSMIDMMIVFTGDLVKRLEKDGAEKFHRVDKVLSRFTMAQIVYLAFGGAMDIDWLHERQTRIGETYTGFVALNIFFGPLIKYVPFTAAWKTAKLKGEIEDMIRSVIAETRRNNAQTDSNESNEVNLISTMINSKNPITGKPMTDDEIIGECTTFLFAGFDTTSISLSWALYHLAQDPDSMRWVQQEVDGILGAPKTARPPTMEDIPNFKRVRAIINETLRLHPPAWTLPRRVSSETKLGNYVVPADAIVQVDVGVIHRNPKYWKRANDFYPQRWTEEEETSRHAFAYAPFSAGLRNCIGKNFAIQEMVIALSIIVSHFSLELDPSQPMIPKRNPLPFPYCFAKFHDRKL